MSAQRCIMCNGVDSKAVFDELGVQVLRCTNCGHIFSSHTVDQHYDGFFGYEALQSDGHFWWGEAHRAMHDDFCRKFIAGRSGRLLDVGCGLGYFVKAVSSNPSWEVFGYEVSRQAFDFARDSLHLQNVFHGKVEESNFDRESFDIITLWDVIEHIPDPDPLLSYLTRLLKPDGMLFMHSPNISVQLPKARLKKLIKGVREDTPYLEARDHVNIYSMRTIKLLLERNGWSAIEFDHLRPVQGVAGGRRPLLTGLKNGWFYAAVAMDFLSQGRINLDNLFVKARLAPQS